MSLKRLETKLNLQGALSGASDVSSGGIVRKFALGGFSSSKNGIANTATTIPLSFVPGTKNTMLFNRESSQAVSKVQNKEDASTQVSVNNKFSIHSSMPEPLAIYSFTKNDAPGLSAAIYQAYFEDRCSLEFSKALIKKVKQNDENVLKQILKNLENEVDIVENNLNVIERYIQTCLQLNSKLNEIERPLVSEIFKENYTFLVPDKLGLDDRGGNDAISILKYVGASLETLSTKSNTSLMTQLLYLASKQMTNGVSPLILGNSTVYPNRMSSGGRANVNYVETSFENDNRLNLKSLSLVGNESQSFLYGVNENASYLQKLKMQTLNDGSKFQKAAYLMSMLANEMAVSTGLAKLEGTQLGQNFTVTGDYRKNFWGMNDQVTDSTTESSVPNSLVDYFVVSQNGKNRLESEKGVLLFDGSRFENTKRRSNAFDAFVVGSLRSPLSKSKNKVEEYSSAQDAAVSRFKSGEEFLKILQCRNDKSKLLTPRGLFTRLIADFSDTLLLLKKQQTAKGKAVNEICLLSILGKNTSILGDNSAVSIIKRSLLTVMAKKTLQLQYSLDTAIQKNTANESQKSSSQPTKTTVTTNTGKETTTTTISVENSSVPQSSQSSQNSPTSFVENKVNPRLCVNEGILFEKKLEASVNSDVAFSIGSLPISKIENSTSYAEIKFSVSSLYDSFSKGQDGFIDKLVKIYVDLCDESKAQCNESNTSAVSVNAIRLTKNSQIDGALLLSLILESACLLAAEFVDANISSDSKHQLETKKTGKPKGFGDAAAQFALVTTIKVRVGEKTQSDLAAMSLGALAKASLGDNFSSVFLPKNGNLIIPEMGSLPKTTPISYDGKTTVSSVVDTMYDLVFERELPILCLSAVASMVQYFYNISEKYKDQSQQLLGNKEQTTEMALLSSFSETLVGKKFFSSMNDFSINAAKRKLSAFKREMKSSEGRNPKITLGELRCIQLLLNDMSNGPDASNFVVVALTKDFVTTSLNRKYTVSSDKENSLQDETMKVSIERSSIFSNQGSSVNFVLFVRSLLSSESFSAFDSKIPTSFSDILMNVTVNENEQGMSYLQKKVDPETASTVLTNEIVSYLFRRMFSTLSSADLFADNISDFDAFAVDTASATIAKTFAQNYGLKDTIFDGVFSKLLEGTVYINENELISLTVTDFEIANSDVGVTLPPLRFGEAELFYDLFETVYFQTGVIANRIFATSIFDETVGLLLRNDSAAQNESEPQTVTTQGIVNRNGVQKSLARQASANHVPSFDTYSLKVLPSSPLVNK